MPRRGRPPGSCYRSDILIRDALIKGPAFFSTLRRLTRLDEHTLSHRLKDLKDKGFILKRDLPRQGNHGCHGEYSIDAKTWKKPTESQAQRKHESQVLRMIFLKESRQHTIVKRFKKEHKMTLLRIGKRYPNIGFTVGGIDSKTGQWRRGSTLIPTWIEGYYLAKLIDDKYHDWKQAIREYRRLKFALKPLEFQAFCIQKLYPRKISRILLRQLPSSPAP